MRTQYPVVDGAIGGKPHKSIEVILSGISTKWRFLGGLIVEAEKLPDSVGRDVEAVADELFRREVVEGHRHFQVFHLPQHPDYYILILVTPSLTLKHKLNSHNSYSY